jgi:C1A family cysteine protease
LRKLPDKADLRKECPAVYNQGRLGSCTANAIGAAFEFELRKQNPASDFMPSRLFIYYNERVIENTVPMDCGASLRDGIKSVHHQGVCPEAEWPYDIGKFADTPPDPCYADALNHQVLSYSRIPRTLDESFESPAVATTGEMDMPKEGEAMIGGHAVLAVGYADSSKRFIIRNSWGAAWGKAGYFTMPYDYLLNANLSDDFWTIRLVELAPQKG